MLVLVQWDEGSGLVGDSDGLGLSGMIVVWVNGTNDGASKNDDDDVVVWWCVWVGGSLVNDWDTVVLEDDRGVGGGECVVSIMFRW